MRRPITFCPQPRIVSIPAYGTELSATLIIPPAPRGLVLFAQTNGNTAPGRGDRCLARMLHGEGFATVVFSLLTRIEESVDAATHHLRFDIALLATRLANATDWAYAFAQTEGLAIGYLGSGAGSAAALAAATMRPELVRAIVTRGGRPDLAGPVLGQVCASTLLIAGSDDRVAAPACELVLSQLTCTSELLLVAGSTRLYDSAEAAAASSDATVAWFTRHLPSPAQMMLTG
jgi:putative phosphoribosyl transferase